MNAKEVLKNYDLSYRQLDLWTSNGYLGSSEDSAQPGSGKRREYSKPELVILERMIAFVSAGVSPAVASAISRGDVEATAKLVHAMEMVQ